MSELVRKEAAEAAEEAEEALGQTNRQGGELPDLLGLDLAELRTLEHPVLSEVVADLRGRAEQPRELLWGFTNAF
ncbi:FxSxx-COOH cyclophane-containing RiPP peptide [Streptomyces sp. NPDC006678]|uniref:FxSxx-COOH cyclophane-containing RiPP peptide n=1 Tax=Streptomyces sp. NPDC006678 TaxID=3157185 RepID=UPI0034038CE2